MSSGSTGRFFGRLAPTDSIAASMDRHPGVFPAELRRLVLQRERNGNPDTAFREIAPAISHGGFPPA